MASKDTEWKRVQISKETLDFSGALHSSLERDGDKFLSLTLKLKDGRTIRIRKNDYSISLEEPVIQTVTKFLVKTEAGLSATFNSEEEAEKACLTVSGSKIEEIKIPVAQEQNQLDCLPF